MRLIFLADLHFSLKQFDWLLARAGEYDLIVIGGDLLDLGASLDLDTQITVIEKYFGLLMKNSKLVVSSGNHDGDSRNAGDESVAQWLQDSGPRAFTSTETVSTSRTPASPSARGGTGTSRAANSKNSWSVRPLPSADAGSGSITRPRRA